jgi:hypothetical protein
MLKFISLSLLLFMLWSCSSNQPSSITQAEEENYEFEAIEIVEEARIDEGYTTPSIRISPSIAKETLHAKVFKEKKILKHISSRVPHACVTWSDGCNTCDKVKKNRASCTVYTCKQKPLFSCLAWQ